MTARKKQPLLARVARVVSVPLLAVSVLLSARATAQPNPDAASSSVADGGGSATKLDALVVTGTHAVGRTVENSPAPIDVLSGYEVSGANQGDLLSALSTILPSFNTPNVSGPDIPSLIRPSDVRG